MSALEVVVVFAADDVAQSVRTKSFTPSFGPTGTQEGDALAGILREFETSLDPIFEAASAPDEALPSFDSDKQADFADDPEDAEMARYFSTTVDDTLADEFAARMRELSEVSTAYVVPPTFNPIAPFDAGSAGLAVPQSSPPAGIIPQYVYRQKYLAPAPQGIGATNAWQLPGGRGAGVQIIDIEGGWQFTHVDLEPNYGLMAGTQYPGVAWRNHGTAVMGEIIGSHDNKGVHGIAPEAKMGAVSHGHVNPQWNSARAIDFAASRLQPGDVLLLEMHRAGPRFNFESRKDQRGYIAVEWWPHDLLAIRRAFRRGVIVVQAAGNGAENLDDPIYDQPAPHFPAGWRNPFSGTIDSGAIIVGAGAPASGNHGPPRSRLDFSNYGQRVDCQGWGAEVTTTGYGDLYKGRGEDEWFTDNFSGTSSASPIVAGAIIQVQGIARARSRRVSPQQARNLLRQFGAEQQASSSAPLSQRIGRQPDVPRMIAALFPS